MGSPSTHEITCQLQAWSHGDRTALERLTLLVEPELRRMARWCLNGKRPDPILETTALVNEAYIRLIDSSQASWQDRAHFFAVCAQIMRRILVDHVRARRTAKRGGGRVPVSLDDVPVVAAEPDCDLVAIDAALDALAKVDQRKSKIVELRFFGGLSVEETAEVLGVSSGTVQRDWRLAKAWLMDELGA